MRVVGEVDFGPTERDWLEWQRYESVINEALADWPLWGLCVFDTQRLPEPAARRRRCTRTRTSSTPSGPRRQPDVHAAGGLPPRRCPVPAEPLEDDAAAAAGPATSPTSSACGTPSPPSWPPSTRPATWSRTSCWPSTR